MSYNVVQRTRRTMSHNVHVTQCRTTYESYNITRCLTMSHNVHVAQYRTMLHYVIQRTRHTMLYNVHVAQCRTTARVTSV